MYNVIIFTILYRREVLEVTIEIKEEEQVWIAFRFSIVAVNLCTKRLKCFSWEKQ